MRAGAVVVDVTSRVDHPVTALLDAVSGRRRVGEITEVRLPARGTRRVRLRLTADGARALRGARGVTFTVESLVAEQERRLAVVLR